MNKASANINTKISKLFSSNSKKEEDLNFKDKPQKQGKQVGRQKQLKIQKKHKKKQITKI